MTKPHHHQTWLLLILPLAIAIGIISVNRRVSAQPGVKRQGNAVVSASTEKPIQKDVNAIKAYQLLNLAIQNLVEKMPPFEAKLRQVTRVDNQEVRAVGRYIQSSQGRGLMRMDLQSQIDDRASRFEQTCDGRLVWTREQIGEDVRIRRVMIGRLDEVQSTTGVPTRLRVGGIPELLDSISHDYDLKLVSGTLNQNQRVLIVRGSLKRERRRAILEAAEQTELPEQMPVSVRVAWVDEEGEFQMLPTTIEFWGEEKRDSLEPLMPISVLDIYEVKKIQPPREDRFRYNTTEEDAKTYVDETQKYLERFRTRLTLNPSVSSLRR